MQNFEYNYTVMYLSIQLWPTAKYVPYVTYKVSELEAREFWLKLS